jgi:hypothetical protein
MDFTLDQLLTIIGRLDDSPGFDTPRDRFRRLLLERMTGLESARLVIQECRARSGEQSHRALQDAVVLCGRFLGFETSYGRYQHDPGAAPFHGVWLSRRRLHVTLTLCTDQTTDINLDAVSHAVTEGDGGHPRLALLVVAPLYAAKDRLEHALAAGKHPNVRLISLPGLVRFCAMVVDGQLAHDDVMQVLNPSVTLDARLELLQRVAAAAKTERVSSLNDPRLLRESEAEASPSVAPEPVPHQVRYWVNVMRPEPLTPTERIVSSLIATRQILGINPAPGQEDRVRPGDAICVFVAGRGIVAHALIAGILTDGSRMIRDSKRFTHVLRLTDVTVYNTPVVPHQELTRKLDLALSADEAAVTTPISRREFESFTTHALSEAG